jgi:EAL domain-containing protein (putative c-di-GMP-specific phosphodiesterase class I)
VDTLIRYADQAMYAAKGHNRHCFSHFKPSMQVAARQRHELSNDLRRALDNGEFAVHYQPIVDLEHGHTVKAEALLRWHHPLRGMVSPGEFIPLAEEIGIIGEIGNWVFEQATAAASRWRSLPTSAGPGRSPIQISVNISPRQFIAGTCAGWIEHLHQLGLPSQVLSLEITEGLLLDDRPAVVDSLLAFREAGVEISIDDFGTGYSAMSYLKKFAVDYLKIDRSFVRDLTTDPSDLAIAEAVIVMAHKLGLKVIAEGVETKAQRDLLRQAGCDYGQGFLYSPAVSEADFCHFLMANGRQ